MKNIKYLILSIFILCLNFTYVKAFCTSEELSTLKKEAEKIKVTYKHLGKVETEEGVSYNNFDVTVKNIPDNFYILILDGTMKLTPTNQIIIETFNSGTWNFEIYANECDEKIDEIKVKIPRFNIYSLDPLCEGINGEDFPLCGKYYEYYVNYEDFQMRVNQYRQNHKIETDNKIIEEENFNIQKLFSKILNYINKYQLYIVISLIVILIMLAIIIIKNKKKKRGVLE